MWHCRGRQERGGRGQFPQGLQEASLHALDNNHLHFLLCTPLPVPNHANSRISMKMHVSKVWQKHERKNLSYFFKTCALNVAITIFFNVSLSGWDCYEGLETTRHIFCLGMYNQDVWWAEGIYGSGRQAPSISSYPPLSFSLLVRNCQLSLFCHHMDRSVCKHCMRLLT